MDQEDRLRSALVDRYTIEREIGSGGMATVYLAQDLKHKRQVAVKVLDRDLAESLGAERFLREIETAANLTHPHILPIHDSGEADGFLYYVMPYARGESLRSRLTKERQLPVEDAIQITREIADALAYAHREGVIHRDVKPANIMLEEGHAVLADFGVAQAVATAKEERMTRTGASFGTPAYMSPEQATGERDLDGRTDQYALGCVLYEMLTGYPPFTGAQVEAVVRQHLTVDPPSVTEARPSVSAEVEKVIRRALSKSPADRFRTTGEMAAALAVTAAPAREAPIRRSPPWLIMGLAVGALAVLALLVWRPWTRDEGSVAAAGPPPWTILADVEGSAPEEMRGIVRSLLESGIDATNVLRVLPEDQVQLGYERMQRPDTTRLDVQVAKELAERANIETVILAKLDRVSSTYALTLRVLKVPGDTLLAIVPETAAGDDALLTACSDAVETLVDRLAGALGGDRSRTIATLSMTSSMEAYRKFLEGVRLNNEGRKLQAKEVFGEALLIDPEFAQAWRLLGAIYNQLLMADSADWARREALKYPERLTEYGRSATEAELTHDPVVKLQFQQRRYGETGVDNGGLALAFLQAGLWHEAVPMFEEMERQFPFGLALISYYNWAYSLVLLGETEEARSLLPKIGSTPLGSQMGMMITLRETGWSELEQLAVEELNDPTSEASNRGSALTFLASAQAARGRVGEALNTLGEIQRIREEAGLQTDRKEIGRFVLTVASESPADGYALGELPPEANVWDRAWEGLWALAMGDTASARSSLAMLPEPELPAFGRPRALGALIVVLQARLAAKQGDWAEAFSLLGGVTGDRAPIVSDFTDEQPRNQLGHWTLAEAQEHLGDFEGAAMTFSGIAAGEQFGWSDLWNLGLTYSFAHRRAALLYGQIGNRGKAIEHWRAFLEAFTRPDPEYQGWVEEARAELARLGG